MARAAISTGAARPGGFTLVELVMVIVITGIIAGIVAVFLQNPMQAYISTVRRAELSDTADTALRRIVRDVQTALPNSVRSSDPLFVEFLPVRSGGRYCAADDCGVAGDALNVTAADTVFKVLGQCVELQTGDSVVIYNTGQSGANAYSADNRSTFAAGSSDASGCAAANTYQKVGFSSFQFPRGSPTYRFDVISTPVTYACDAANGTLWRFTGYTIQAAQPVALSSGSLVTAGGNIAGSRLATNVVCAGSLGTGFEVRNGDGLVSIRIQLTSSGETLNLYREAHIQNAP